MFDNLGLDGVAACTALRAVSKVMIVTMIIIIYQFSQSFFFNNEKGERN